MCWTVSWEDVLVCVLGSGYVLSLAGTCKCRHVGAAPAQEAEKAHASTPVLLWRRSMQRYTRRPLQIWRAVHLQQLLWLQLWSLDEPVQHLLTCPTIPTQGALPPSCPGEELPLENAMGPALGLLIETLLFLPSEEFVLTSLLPPLFPLFSFIVMVFSFS